MRMYDLIEKKKRGGELSREEIREMITGYVGGEIPDYQMSAMLMAICFRGMTDDETLNLTLEMEYSGDIVDLSSLPGCKVDKHSTGGVGDKTTLIVAPVAAACGAVVAKMSGRGLGHTGGTLDKLESIPGFRTGLTQTEFMNSVRKHGICVIGQTADLVPADRKLYALRDVTATVDCIPLIASSIMSKKLAAGSDAILLDVKTGSGAFMKTPEQAHKLAEQMVRIGRLAGRKTEAVITDMDVPLGHAIGNALEVREAVEVLKNGGPEDLREEGILLASRLLVMAGLAGEEDCRRKAEGTLADGSALAKLAEMAEAQGGDPEVIFHPEQLAVAPVRTAITAAGDGYITHMDTEAVGLASMLLGAGREKKDDILDYGAGIQILRKTGDRIQQGDILAEFYTSDRERLPAAEKMFRSGIRISDDPVPVRPLVFGQVR